MEISKYVRTIEYKDNLFLYNTVNQMLIEIPKQVVNAEGRIVVDLDEETLSLLQENYFFVDTDLTIEKSLPNYIKNPKKLFISVELNLSCNLCCPYCYQAGKHNGKTISDETIVNLSLYVKKVYEESPFEELYLKILGGEPTIVWSKFEKTFQSLFSLCKKIGVKLHLLIDTNGVFVDKLLTLKGYDSLLLTIPLTYKKCHDKVRIDKNGNGSYDTILRNIYKIHQEKPETKIVLRYNVDGTNQKYFKLFLEDIKKNLNFNPLISVNYTAEFSEYYKSTISYLDFIEWSSTHAIDDLVMANLPVTISPIVSIEECQFRSKYSLKLFSDGSVGSCAMSFFDKERLSIKELLNEFDENKIFFESKSKQSLLSDNICLKCKDIFLCGGTNKLPCIKALNPDMCKNKVFSINIEKFIKKYIEYSQLGKNDLFVVFENGEAYR